MNGFLSYLCDSSLRRGRKSSLYIDQASSEILFFHGYVMLCVAAVLLCGECVEGTLDAGSSHCLVAKRRGDTGFESPTDPELVHL